MERELQVISAINKKNSSGFPKIHSVLTEAGESSVVMNYLGQSLSHLLHCDRLSKADILRIGVQTLGFLKRMHIAGYVHCDMRPENIMVLEDEKGCF